MKRRIFVGVRIPSEVRELYQLARTRSSEFNWAIRWVGEENLHLTVAFLGWLGETQVSMVSDLLDQVVKLHRPFEMQIVPRIRGYPSTTRANVLLLPVEKVKEFEDLRSTFLVRFHDRVTGGKHCSRKVNLPHLTLGRVTTQSEFLKQRLRERSKIADKPVAMVVAEVVLWESNLRPSGVEYSVLGEFPL